MDITHTMYHKEVKNGYGRLYDELMHALDQAQTGKGCERHGNGLAFVRQQILTETHLLGLGFPIGQARKKAGESIRLASIKGNAAAKREIYGAIVYLCAAAIYLEGD